jgi:hypothetical protein
MKDCAPWDVLVDSIVCLFVCLLFSWLVRIGTKYQIWAYSGNQIKTKVMVVICDMNREQERWVQGFGEES